MSSPKPLPGRGYADPLQEVAAIRRGVPVAAFDALARQGVVGKAKLHQLVVPERSLRARRAHGKPFSPRQSEALRRVQRIVDQALAVFEDSAKASSYLNKPMRRFGGASCIDMLDTDVGADLVAALLVRVDHGVLG